MIQRKLHSIQSLRTIAAISVVLFHAHQAFTLRNPQPAFYQESYIFGFGAVGVHIFFVISGFIMVYTTDWNKPFDSANFFRKRFFRIYPTYWLCFVLYLIFHALNDSQYDLSFFEYILSIALWPGYSPLIIGPAWTLSFEIFFYASFGVVMMLGLDRGMLVLGTFFLGLILLGLISAIEHPMWQLTTDALLLEFLAGSGIGWLLLKGRLPSNPRLMLSLAVILFAAGIAWGYEDLPSVVMWGIPSSLLVAGAIMHENIFGISIIGRFFSYFGNSSYSLYLIHILVISIMMLVFEYFSYFAQVSPLFFALSSLAISILLAELLYQIFERPLLNWARSKSSHRAIPTDIIP